MARAQGARAVLALGVESTYGTPPAPGTYFRMPFASSTLGADQPLLASELLGQGRDPVAPVLDAVTADGDVVVPIDHHAIGFWLKGAFGEPVTTGSDPWTHTFESGSWSLPSFAIEVGMPEVPLFSMYAGCRVDTLSWTMQRSGLLTGTVRLVVQGETNETSTQVGSAPTLFERRFGHVNGSVSRDGTPLGNVVSAECSYQNNLDRIETIRADGLIDGADPSMAAMTGRIEVRFADTVLLDQAADGDPCELEFSWSQGDTSLTFTVPSVYLPRPRRELRGPGGVMAMFEWQASVGDSEPMVTAVLVNNRATY